jgi:uncharacterized protein (DUF1919 family)
MKTCYIYLRKKIWQGLILKKINNQNFTILSDDCWGAEIYRKLGLEYKTPCVGLMIKAPCFVNLLENFDDKIANKLKFVKKSKYPQLQHTSYPIGTLDGDIEIHFYHYSSEAEADRKWQRRVKRINKNNLFYKLDAEKTKQEFPDNYIELIEKFNRLSGKKIVLNTQPENVNEHSLLVKNWGFDGRLMFKKSLLFFDLAHWLNTGKLINSFGNQVAYYLLLAPRAKKGME